jgi:hypothetical protein
MTKVTVEFDSEIQKDAEWLDALFGSNHNIEEQSLFNQHLNLVKQSILLREKFNASHDLYRFTLRDRILKLDLGRCTYKSKTIIELKQGNDIVIVGTSELRKMLYPGIDRVFTLEQVINHRLRGLVVDRIYIDDASVMDKNIKSMMYQELSVFRNPFIIELG